MIYGIVGAPTLDYWMEISKFCQILPLVLPQKSTQHTDYKRLNVNITAARTMKLTRYSS
jgi:hypothetical protein